MVSFNLHRIAQVKSLSELRQIREGATREGGCGTGTVCTSREGCTSRIGCTSSTGAATGVMVAVTAVTGASSMAATFAGPGMCAEALG